MSNPARQKVEHEGCCRCCGAALGYLDAAHTIDRSLSASGFVDADLIVPLCSAIRGSDDDCHGRYDRHELDLLPFLSKREQAAMVFEVGMVRAMRRVSGPAS